MAINVERRSIRENDQIINAGFVSGDLYSEYFLTCSLHEARDNNDLEHRYELLVRQLIQHKIAPVYERIFGYLSERSSLLKIRSRIYRMFAFSPEAVPFSYIEGAPAMKGARWAGVHLYGVSVNKNSELNIKDIIGEGGCCGKLIAAKDVRQVYIFDLGGEDKTNREHSNEKNEIRNIFTNLNSSLQNAGFEAADLVRTWFHLRDILPRYNEFNQARGESYAGKIAVDRLPASTAIQGKPASGRDISLDALAIRSKNGNGPIVRTMTSPVQPEAKTYGPLFSRGIEIAWPGYKILHISGTASIDEEGISAYPEDSELQVSNTLNYISLLLNKYGAAITDIVQANAYFKYPELESAFSDILKQNCWEDIPCLRMCGDICRADLFFEMDCIAAVQM